MIATDEDGSVALEAVLVAPVVALLVAAVVGLVAVVTDQLVAERTARAVARAVAVTGSAARATDGLPPTAEVSVRRGAGHVTVEVVLPGSVVGLGYRASATATAALEPGAP